MPREPAPRLLRAFVAVAEELHFTRAASRLYVAQQALSRDVRALERELGATLFVRSTRSVGLTPEGERLLAHARRVLAAYDELSGAFTGEPRRPLSVDAAAQVSTGQRVLDAAREAAPSVEFVARYYSGLVGAAEDLLAGRLDLSFGRVAGLPSALLSGLGHRFVRHERVAVLLPAAHRLAARAQVPLAELAGETLYAGAGNPDTTEWTAYARSLFAGRGIRLADPFPKIEGEREFARVVRGRGWCVLATSVFVGVEGMVLRPVVDPVPLSPVSVVWRAGLRHPGLDAVLDTASRLGDTGGWRTRPKDSWLPPEDAALLERGEAPG